MDKLVIQGGCRLEGKIEAGGSKNCALPVLFATLLAPGRHQISNVPRLKDMESTAYLLSHLGTRIDSGKDFQSSNWTLDATNIDGCDAPYDLVRKMRASFLCLGPLVARMGRARVSLPGGCAIGARPIDLHLFALEKLGAEVEQLAGFVEARLPKGKNRLVGGKILFPMVSVGATENAVIAACLAQGTTIIENAAREPEVVGLIEALKTMGAKIKGQGTSTLEIEGSENLGPMNYRIPPDRIETATYLIGAQLTGGNVEITNARPQDLQSVIEALEKTGAEIRCTEDRILLKGSSEILPVDIKTAPFPAFPTDVQAQWMTLMTNATGDSLISETIFENRFMHVPELIRMGARLHVQGSIVKVRGQRGILQGAPVMATDLRASASLVLAGLAAKGETVVKRIYHLDRGYERMEMKLQKLGARIERQLED